MLVDRFCIGLSFGNFCLFTIFFTLEALQLTTFHLDKFKLSSKSSLVAHMPVSALDFAQVSLIFIKYFNFGLQISTRLFKSVQLVKLTFPSSNWIQVMQKPSLRNTMETKVPIPILIANWREKLWFLQSFTYSCHFWQSITKFFDMMVIKAAIHFWHFDCLVIGFHPFSVSLVK